MAKKTILIQLDCDQHASVFDAVVAVDSGVDSLLQYENVEPTAVDELVNGAIFTRGPKSLNNTAIFIGGSNVRVGETLLKQVTDCFFGPMRVSVMLDANGANTTAAAAVLTASRHIDLSGAQATVLGATGPVGQRVVRLLARQGASVRVASRRMDRAEAVCKAVEEQLKAADKPCELTPIVTISPHETAESLAGSQLMVAAGALGIELVSEDIWKSAGLKVAIDLNAKPPLGIGGVEMMDAAVQRHDVVTYGAIGVGNLKMKIHKAAIARLFQSNDAMLDAEEIYDLGAGLSD